MADLGTAVATLLLPVLPLVSGALWLAIGIWPLVRYRYGSPFARTLTGAAWLFGAYALIDWIFFQTTDPGLAVLLSEVRATIFSTAIALLFVSSKWIYAGHAKYDILLVLPGLASIAVVWGGMTLPTVVPQAWGPQLVRDRLLYGVWAGIQLAYILGAIVLTLSLFRARARMVARLRWRIFWTAASLLAILAAWTTTNVYNNVTQTAGVPWFSTLLSIPALIIIAAFLPLSTAEIGDVFRAVSEVERRVTALYVFYRSGEPLAAVAASRTFPIEAEQLQGILDVVGNFVETSMKAFRGYAVTVMRFDRLGIVAVRGQYLLVAAVYDGPAYDAIRSELLRSMRDFEGRRWEALSNWEGATKVAEEIADDLSRLLQRPGSTAAAGATTAGANREA